MSTRVIGRAKPYFRTRVVVPNPDLTGIKAGSSGLASSAELKLIGKKTDEAVEMVDKFLDAAFMNGQIEVRIIHGHGTGALRRAVAEMLADHPHVARFSAAPQDQGGGGATIVELKQ